MLLDPWEESTSTAGPPASHLDHLRHTTAQLGLSADASTRRRDGPTVSYESAFRL